MVKKFTIPKKPGACIDKLYALKQEIKEKNKVIDAIKEDCNLLEDHIMKYLEKEKLTSSSGVIAKVSTNLKSYPNVKDRNAFEKFILKTKDFSLITGSPKAAAIKEHWENGEKIPGVEPFTKITLSVRKV